MSPDSMMANHPERTQRSNVGPQHPRDSQLQHSSLKCRLLPSPQAAGGARSQSGHHGHDETLAHWRAYDVVCLTLLQNNMRIATWSVCNRCSRRGWSWYRIVCSLLTGSLFGSHSFLIQNWHVENSHSLVLGFCLLGPCLKCEGLFR